MPQPNPVSLGLGQLERNRSKSCMSANSVTVELPRDVAKVCTKKVGRMICLKGKSENDSTGITGRTCTVLVCAVVWKFLGVYRSWSFSCVRIAVGSSTSRAKTSSSDSLFAELAARL